MAQTAPRPRWFLSFDCATKTFAFGLVRVDAEAIRAGGPGLRARARAAEEVLRRAGELAGVDPARARALVATVALAVAAMDAEARGYFCLADGEAVDLFPGRSDDDIPTVERVRAVARYVAARVRPAVARHVPPGERHRVLVEYQMGPNAPARTVATALVTLFADDDVVIVGPSLKNKVAVCDEGQYYRFAERYARAYDANKAHTKYNFARLEAAFGSGIPASRPPGLRGHIADSVMQVLGHLAHGDEEKAALLF
jgi:hypothetical protein